jgi:hypothetical protein
VLLVRIYIGEPGSCQASDSKRQTAQPVLCWGAAFFWMSPFYFIDADFGLIHVRLQAWFPMTRKNGRSIHDIEPNVSIIENAAKYDFRIPGRG